jgi:hypothetical protein
MRVNMAFASFHNEEAFKTKTLAYINDASVSLNVVEKKWSRVPDKTKDWTWGNVEMAVSKIDALSDEQQARFDEVKAAVGK